MHLVYKEVWCTQTITNIYSYFMYPANTIKHIHTITIINYNKKNIMGKQSYLASVLHQYNINASPTKIRLGSHIRGSAIRFTAD